jgi:hypothetical protein
MTTRPTDDGTVIYTPFPDFEMADPPGAFRITYRLAGQMVAVRSAGVLDYTYTEPMLESRIDER